MRKVSSFAIPPITTTLQPPLLHTMPSAEIFAAAGRPDGQYTASNGAPYNDPHHAQRIASYGGNQVGSSLLLQDFHLIDLLAHFDRGELISQPRRRMRGSRG